MTAELMGDTHENETLNRQRFAFGANWSHFLSVLDDHRIAAAVQSLCEKLHVTSLDGMRFLDAGSGSGLFSLAARRLRATVHSFDFDPQSVACTNALRDKYSPNDPAWIVEEASVLDQGYLAKLGQFDVVYSWGVLHHTGAMWSALENISILVADGGLLFVAIYNDQSWISKYWRAVKRNYLRNAGLKWLMILIHAPYLVCLRYVVRKIQGRQDLGRGMSLWHDMIDWIGGYPFEVARPEEIFRFYLNKRFSLIELKTCGGRHGCNEFVFRKAI